MASIESNVQRSRFDDKGILRVQKLNPGAGGMTMGFFSHHSDKEANQVEEGIVSDSESCTSGSSVRENSSLFGSTLVRLDEEDALHKVISHKFTSDLAAYGMHTYIHAIHRNVYSSVTGEAKLQAFLNFLRATEKKNNGDANWKYAWYCGSKQDIGTILSHGFGHTVNTGIYGRGIYLCPSDYPLQSLHLSTADEDGLRHFLLCRVILGRMELIRPGSEQCHPSSEEFDSGVDNLLTPTKYIVWSTHMNTHILPDFVISIRAPPATKGNNKFVVPLRKPNSPWMPLSTLISTLSQYLAPDSIKLIQKYHIEHRERRITRQEMIKRIRQITGDALLVGVIKAYSDKLEKSKGSSSFNKGQQHRG